MLKTVRYIVYSEPTVSYHIIILFYSFLPLLRSVLTLQVERVTGNAMNESARERTAQIILIEEIQNSIPQSSFSRHFERVSSAIYHNCAFPFVSELNGCLVHQVPVIQIRI